MQEIIDDPKKDYIYLVQDYHSKGSLGDNIKRVNESYKRKCEDEGRTWDNKKIGLKLKDIQLYFIDMLKALYYCHETVKVIHRDIKPDNIMINHNNEAILIDFGVSALFDQQEDDCLTKNMGT